VLRGSVASRGKAKIIMLIQYDMPGYLAAADAGDNDRPIEAAVNREQVHADDSTKFDAGFGSRQGLDSVESNHEIARRAGT
jgi:hypothetical protein